MIEMCAVYMTGGLKFVVQGSFTDVWKEIGRARESAFDSGFGVKLIDHTNAPIIIDSTEVVAVGERTE